MAARGKRWTLEPGHSPCACGAQVAVVVNQRNGDRLMREHKTPTGGTCPELSWQDACERTNALFETLIEKGSGS